MDLKKGWLKPFTNVDNHLELITAIKYKFAFFKRNEFTRGK